jgi:hypothetical protein
MFACDAQSQFWFVVVIPSIQTDGPQNSSTIEISTSLILNFNSVKKMAEK